MRVRGIVDGEATGARLVRVWRLPAVRDRQAAARPAATSSRTRRIVASDELAPGAHLVTPRRGYTHHGIYVGDGKVVHYAGLARSLQRGPVEETSLDEFGGGHVVALRIGEPARYDAATVVERARSRLGEDRYRITTNNCEHFCEWCLRGESRSRQVERFVVWPRRAAWTGLQALRRLARLVPRAPRAGTA